MRDEVDPNLAEPNPWKGARDYLIRLVRDKLERELRRLQEQTQEFDPQQKAEFEDEVLGKIKELTGRIEDLRRTMIS